MSYLSQMLALAFHNFVSAATSMAIAIALVRFAGEHHVTQLVLGQSARTRLDILVHGSVINHILRHARNVDLHIMADRAKEG
jgi:K+-sensing histidine kinase KdpD